MAAQLTDRYGPGAADVTGLVLGVGPDVQHDEVAVVEPGGELVAVDDLDAVAVAEVGAGELLEPGHMRFGHVTTASRGRRRGRWRAA